LRQWLSCATGVRRVNHLPIPAFSSPYPSALARWLKPALRDDDVWRSTGR